MGGMTVTRGMKEGHDSDEGEYVTGGVADARGIHKKNNELWGHT